MEMLPATAAKDDREGDVLVGSSSNSSGGGSSLRDLDQDCLIHIMAKLGARDLAAASCSCRCGGASVMCGHDGVCSTGYQHSPDQLLCTHCSVMGPIPDIFLSSLLSVRCLKALGSDAVPDLEVESLFPHQVGPRVGRLNQIG